MRLLRVEVAPQKARRLLELVVPETDGEIRLLTLVRAGRTVQAVRTDEGLIRDFPPDLHLGGLDRVRALADAPEVERLVSLNLEPDGSPPSVFEGLVQGSIEADPPWIPAMERVRKLPRWVRSGLARLLPPGAYGVALPDLDAAICARISPAATRQFAGLTACDLTVPDRDPERFVRLMRGRFGRPQLAVVGSEPAVRAVLTSRRPLAALERAEIRGELIVATASLRVRMICLLLRLLGA